MSRDFGCEYPPGVTGNEPQIAGYDESSNCVVCAEPLDPADEYPSAPDDSGYFCQTECEMRWLLENGATVKLQLDAALELESEVVLIRPACEPVEGVVVGRHTFPDGGATYTIEEADGEERDVFLSMIDKVEAVEDE